MTTDDLAAVLALTRMVAEAPAWNESHFTEIVASEGAHSAHFRRGWVGIAAEEVIGFIVLQGLQLSAQRGAVTGNETECEIESIVVRPDHQRRGVGRLLLRTALDWSRRQATSFVRLEVRSRNAAAISLYRRCGFARVGTRPRYYAAPEDDAMLMALDLRR